MQLSVLQERVNDPKWFHRIDLGQGVITPGKDDSPPKLAHEGFARTDVRPCTFPGRLVVHAFVE